MTANRGKRISEAEFRRMWMNSNLPVREIAKALGINVGNVSARAKRRGLPSRNAPNASARVHGIDCPLFAKMWLAGVGTRAMAAHYGVSSGTPTNTARRLSLPARGNRAGYAMTVADFFALQLRIAMAASARETQAALWNADMVDGDPRRRAA